MQVLQVAHYYKPLGGIEKVVYQFSHLLKDSGFDVEVLVCNTGFRTERVTEEGVPVTRVGRLAHLARISIAPTFPFWLRRLQPQCLHVHMVNPLAEASVLAAGTKVPTIATYHMDITRQKRLKHLYQPIQKRFLDRVDLVTASSRAFAESSPVLSRYIDKVRVVPFWVDPPEPLTSSEEEKLKLLRKKFPGPIVLFVGRLIHYKGLHVLVEAMQQVAGTCLITGTGYLQTALQEQIEALGLADKIHLLGWVEDEDLPCYYHLADVFALPSLNRTESFGISQLDAMKYGVPVVCTEIGTGTSYVNQHGETGLVVPPSDSEALADALSGILSDEDLKAKLQQGARQRAQTEFSYESTRDRLLEVYREAGQTPGTT